MFFNVVLSKIFLGKVTLTIHDVSSFANDKETSFYSIWIYKLADLFLTHNEFSKNEILRLTNVNGDSIKIISHGNYIPFINVPLKCIWPLS